jgi:hypothetical protein
VIIDNSERVGILFYLNIAMQILLVSLYTALCVGHMSWSAKPVHAPRPPKGVFTSLYFIGPDTVKDYLHLPGPIEFNGTSYRLAWTAHPAKNYYKQEYIPKRNTVEHYDKMVFLDVVMDTGNLRDAVRAKLVQLELRKRKDSVVNYKLFQNPDSTEYILDFVLSDGEPFLNVVEWDVYRYKTFVDSSGHKGYQLFANSLRAYGDEINGFFGTLGATRKRVIALMVKYDMPVIDVRDE